MKKSEDDQKEIFRATAAANALQHMSKIYFSINYSLTQVFKELTSSVADSEECWEIICVNVLTSVTRVWALAFILETLALALAFRQFHSSMSSVAG